MAEWINLCRGCLAAGPQISLFDADTCIHTKFYDCTSIEVKEDDGLPPKLCQECVDIITAAHNFRKQCLRIHAELTLQLNELNPIDRSKNNEDIQKTGEDIVVKDTIDTNFHPTQKGEEKMDPETFIKQELIEGDDNDDNEDDFYYVLVIDDENKDKQLEEQLKMFEKIKPEPLEQLTNFSQEDLDEETVNLLNNDLVSVAEPDTDEMPNSENAEVNHNALEIELQNSNEDMNEEAMMITGEPEITLTEDNIEKSGEIMEGIDENNEEVDNENLMQILAEAGADGRSLLKVDGNSRNEIVTYMSDQLLENEDGVHQEEVIVCEAGDEGDQYEIVNYDGSGDLVIEYTDEGQFATVIQQEDGTFLCECGTHFEDLSDYDKHQWTHHNNNAYNCSLCGKGFESEEILTGHMLLHNQNGQHILCPYCDQWIKRNSLTQHIKFTHNHIKPQCSECFKTFANPNNLKRHMMIHAGVKAFECDICFRRFNQKITMQTHKLTHGVSLACTTCDIYFNTQEEMEIHEAQHEVSECNTAADSLDVKPELYITDGDNHFAYACPMCEKIFSVETALQFHIENAHGTEKMELLCSECGEVLPTRRAMFAHSFIHRQIKGKGMKRFSCMTCGKSCASQAMLIMHERVHTNERPFPCSLCALRFKTKTHLRTHQLTHTREKKFGCSVCMKFFALKGNLVVHLRTHTGERPYVCSLCGDAFIDSKYLKKHKLRKHSIVNLPWNQY